MLARLRGKNLHRWLSGYLRQRAGRALRARYQGHRHLLFAFCDHFEPFWRGPPDAVARARVQAWHEGYPALARQFRDSDGRPPRHTFFYPGEDYRAPILDRLAALVRAGIAEVEVHLHHDGDTPETLRGQLEQARGRFTDHGLLGRHEGRPRYAFIHGNWCLANARRDGRHCGVDPELPLLFATGCYADFTFPAAPDESQPPLVNQIYWPEGDLGRARAQDRGRRARVGDAPGDRILIVEGPLALVRGPGRRLVRIENAAITAADPATPERLRTWVAQEIQVEGRPEWVFVKVHTHGAPEPQAASLLGGGGRGLHEALAALAAPGGRWSLHYVSAREMYNVARAAMDGRTGPPSDYFDYQIGPPPAAARA